MIVTPPPFTPRNGATSTVNLVVTAVAQPFVLPRAARDGGQIRLTVIGSQTIFVAFSGAASLTTSMPLLAGSVEVFSVEDGTTLSVIAGAAGSTLYATGGEGN